MFEETIDQFFVPPANSTISGPVFLLKENDVVSEQTFLIVIEVSEATPPSQNNINRATRGADFTSADSLIVQFLPRDQRVNFQFDLLPDDFPERTESFLVVSAPEDTGQHGGMAFDAPSYLSPVTLSDRTYVIIEDNDRKFPVSTFFFVVIMLMNRDVANNNDIVFQVLLFLFCSAL